VSTVFGDLVHGDFQFAADPGLGQSARELAGRRLGTLPDDGVQSLRQREAGLQGSRDKLQHVRKLLGEGGLSPRNAHADDETHAQPADQRPNQDSSQQAVGNHGQQCGKHETHGAAKDHPLGGASCDPGQVQPQGKPPLACGAE
jgi:hypothetical protein